MNSQTVTFGGENHRSLPLVAPLHGLKMTDVSPLGERIVAAMHDAGLDRELLAERAGIASATLSRYINGKRAPRHRQITSLASVLQVTVQWLLDGAEPRYQAILSTDVDLDLSEFSWPPGTPEAIRIAVQQQVLAEREAHRQALIPYWKMRARTLLESELRRRR